MVLIIEQFIGYIFHIVILLGIVVCVLNAKRTQNNSWYLGALGLLLIEIGLLSRMFGASYTVEGGTWKLTQDSSMAVFYLNNLPTLGVVLLLICSYKLGLKNI